MQQFTTNSIIIVACSTAIWFGVKAACRFFFTRYSSTFLNRLILESATKQQLLPATASKQQLHSSVTTGPRSEQAALSYISGT
jgi:hypothetical protein